MSEQDRWLDKPTLRGPRVLLRPFVEEDLPVVARILADPEIGRLTGSVTTTAEAMAATPEIDDRTREWYLTRAQAPDRLDLAVVDRERDLVVGEVVLNELDRDNRSCNFRTLIGPDGRDRGLGTEACRMIVDHGFSRLGMHRISLSVFDFNPRARRVYEKVGFVLEGTRRESFRFDDDWIDDHDMAILEQEWRARS
ncbi:GNAT family protein [Luteipulveratus sp. YIM 133132]|uniref:GNAT family N-acetyltransferase n=1 Tax=Luteipulveratus flavus TaxID=3031728 RepID=UPI0023B1E204|nr:GNAT family protein [Luteipulveratus sp. YIM 133132]MDE9364354.1 GNAT family protein [Luteipulveratus sp. YIM 133132]